MADIQMPVPRESVEETVHAEQREENGTAPASTRFTTRVVLIGSIALLLVVSALGVATYSSMTNAHSWSDVRAARAARAATASASDCSPGCYDGWEGDGYCDAACMTESCNYDDGDCDMPGCNPECDPTTIGDGECNFACAGDDCENDHGDCEASWICMDQGPGHPCDFSTSDDCVGPLCGEWGALLGECVAGGPATDWEDYCVCAADNCPPPPPPLTGDAACDKGSYFASNGDSCTMLDGSEGVCSHDKCLPACHGNGRNAYTSIGISNGGDVCCASDCGQCGGPGCGYIDTSGSGDAYNTAAECCTSNIRAANRSCLEHGPPCVFL